MWYRQVNNWPSGGQTCTVIHYLENSGQGSQILGWIFKDHIVPKVLCRVSCGEARCPPFWGAMVSKLSKKNKNLKAWRILDCHTYLTCSREPLSSFQIQRLAKLYGSGKTSGNCNKKKYVVVSFERRSSIALFANILSYVITDKQKLILINKSSIVLTFCCQL